MSNVIDERVLRMEMDIDQFESAVNSAIAHIDKLNKALENSNSSKAFEGVTKTTDSLSKTLSQTVDNISSKMDALQSRFSFVGEWMRKLENSVVSSAGKFGKEWSGLLTGFAQISDGMKKFEQKTGNVATLMTATGASIEDVSAALEDLQWFTDETSYDFVTMSNVMSKFSASGEKDLKKLAKVAEGIALWGAESGANAQTASRVMNQLSQAYGKGKIQLQDWVSVETAVMSTEKIQNMLLEEGGKAAQDAMKKYGDFRDSLRAGWLTTDVFNNVMYKYTQGIEQTNYAHGEFIRTIDEAADGVTEFSVKAFRAAQEARTLTDVINAIKEANASGWSTTYEAIFGNYEEATALWTGLVNGLLEVTYAFSDFRNEVLGTWKELGGRTALIESFINAWNALNHIIQPIKQAFVDIFPPITGQRLYDLTVKLRDWTAGLVKNQEQMEKVYTVASRVLLIIKLLGRGISEAFKFLYNLKVDTIGTQIRTLIDKIGQGVSKAVLGTYGLTDAFKKTTGSIKDGAKSFDIYKASALAATNGSLNGFQRLLAKVVALTGSFKEFRAGHLETAKELGGTAWVGFLHVLDKVKKGVIVLGAGFVALGITIGKVISSIKPENILNKFTGVILKITKLFDTLVSKFRKKDTVDSLSKALAPSTDSLTAWQRFVLAIKGFGYRILSVLKTVKEFAKLIGTGLVVAVASAAYGLYTFGSKVVSVGKTIGGALTKAVSKAIELIGKLKTTLSSKWPTLKANASSGFGSFLTILGKIREAMAKVGKDAEGSFVKGFTKASRAIQEIYSNSKSIPDFITKLLGAGFTAALKGTGSVAKSISKAFTDLFDTIKKSDKASGSIKNVSDLFKTFFNFIKTTGLDVLGRFTSKLKEFLKMDFKIPTLQQLIDKIKELGEKFSKFLENIGITKDSILSTLLNPFQTALDILSAFGVKSKDSSGEILQIGENFESSGDAVRSFNDDANAGMTVFDKLKEKVTTVIESLKKFCEKAGETTNPYLVKLRAGFESFLGFMQGLPWDKILAVATIVGYIFVIKKLADGITSLGSTVESVSTAFQNKVNFLEALLGPAASLSEMFKSFGRITEIYDKVKDYVYALQTQMQKNAGANNFLKIAGGIAILAAAFTGLAFAMKKLEWSDLGKAAAVIIGLAVSFGVLATHLGKLSDKVVNPVSLIALGAALVTMSAAIGMAIGSFMKMKDALKGMSLGEIFGTIASMAAMGGMLVGLASTFKWVGPTLISSTLTLLAFALMFNKFVSVMSVAVAEGGPLMQMVDRFKAVITGFKEALDLADQGDSDKLQKYIYGIIGGLLGLIGVFQILKIASALTATVGKGLIGISLALGIMWGVLKLFEKFPVQNLDKLAVDIVLVAGGLLVFVGAISLLDKVVGISDTIKNVGKAMLGMAASMYILVAAVKALADPKVDLDRAAWGMLIIVAGIISMAGAIAIMGKAQPGRVAAAMLGMVISFYMLIPAMMLFSAIGWKKAIVGVGAVAVALLALGGAIRLMGQTSWTSIIAGMVGVITIVGALVVACLLLQNVNPNVILNVGIAFGIMIGMFAIAADILNTAGKGIVGTMFALAGALILVGVAAIPFGFGMSLLANVPWQTIAVAGLVIAGLAAALGLIGHFLPLADVAFAAFAGVLFNFGVACAGFAVAAIALGVALPLIGVGITIITKALSEFLPNLLEFITRMTELGALNITGINLALFGMGAAFAILGAGSLVLTLGFYALAPAIERLCAALGILFELLEPIGGVFSSVKDRFSGFMDIFTSFTPVSEGFSSDVQTNIIGVLSDLVTSTDNTSTSIKGSSDSIVESLKNIGTSAKETLGSWKDNITNALDEAGEAAYNGSVFVGNNVNEGYAIGLEQSQGIDQSTADMANGMIKLLCSILQIHSPSEVLRWIASMCGEGFLQGWLEEQADIYDATGEFSMDFMGLLEGMMGEIPAIGAEGASGLADTFTTAFASVKDAIGGEGGFGGLLTTLQSYLPSFSQIGAEGGNNLGGNLLLNFFSWCSKTLGLAKHTVAELNAIIASVQGQINALNAASMEAQRRAVDNGTYAALNQQLNALNAEKDSFSGKGLFENIVGDLDPTKFFTDIENALKGAGDELNKFGGAADGAGGSAGGAAKSTKEAAEEAKKHEKAVKLQTKAVEEFVKTYGGCFEALEGTTDATEIARTAIEDLARSFGLSEDEIADTEKDIEELFMSMYDSIHSSVDGAMKIFEKFSSEMSIAPEAMLKNMRSNFTGISEWAEEVQMLAAKGFSKGLVEDLVKEGPSAQAKVRTFLKMTFGQVLEANDLYAKKAEATAEASLKAITAMAFAGKNQEEFYKEAALLNMAPSLDEANKYFKDEVESFSKLGVDISKAVFGNIDLNNRQVLELTEDTIKEYHDVLADWMDPDELKNSVGSVATVLGGSDWFGDEESGLEIAFSPILQTENGPKVLSRSTIDKYINGVLDKARTELNEFSDEDLLRIDAEGFEVDGIKVKNIIADIGDTAVTTGEAMHYLGTDGSIAQGMQGIAAASKKAYMEAANHMQKVVVTYRELRDTIADTVESQIDLFSEFDMKTETSADQMLKNMHSQIQGTQDWANGLQVLAQRGIDDGLLLKLKELGPKGYDQVNAFVQMTADQLAQANQYYQQSLVLPDQVATQVSTSYLNTGISMAQSMINGVTQSQEQMNAMLAQFAQAGANATNTAIQGGTIDTKGVGVNMATSIANGEIESADTTVVPASKEVVQAGATAAEGVAKTAMEMAGYYAVEGMANSMIKYAYMVQDAAAQVGASANVGITSPKALDENSPSAKWGMYGMYAVMGLANSMYDYSYLAGDAATGIGGDISDSMRLALEQANAILNDDVNAQPTITPVLDLSQVQNGSGYLNSLLGNSAYSIGTNLNGLGSIRLGGEQPVGNTSINYGGFNIEIYSQPGMDEQALANYVTQQIYTEILSREAVVY